jgi:hypothetical protein
MSIAVEHIRRLSAIIEHNWIIPSFEGKCKSYSSPHPSGGNF